MNRFGQQVNGLYRDIMTVLKELQVIERKLVAFEKAQKVSLGHLVGGIGLTAISKTVGRVKVKASFCPHIAAKVVCLDMHALDVQLQGRIDGLVEEGQQ